MSLENINCPQFVDFCSVDTFDIHDGADFCFEKGVVGEDAKLNQKESEKDVENLITVLSNATNLNKNNDQEHKTKAKILNKPENKENSAKSGENEKKPDIVGTTVPGVGSAIDLVNSKQQRAKTPVKTQTVPNPSNHKRTLSTSSATSTNTVSKQPDKPLLPLYRGVRFIPKLAHKYSNNSESYTPPGEDKSKQNQNQNQSTHKPVIATNSQPQQEKKTSGLTRSTPGKSASFKQNPAQKKTNIITNFTANIIKTKTTMTKTTSYSSDAEFNLSSSSELNKSRKKSDNSNKPVGFLHTELRALKRNEYEQHMKEKERMANLIKQDLEQEKMKKQQEEIQKLRLKNTFKSNPIKHYKPIEVKPSEKPLTEPKSPQFASLQDSKMNNSKHNSTNQSTE